MQARHTASNGDYDDDYNEHLGSIARSSGVYPRSRRRRSPFSPPWPGFWSEDEFRPL
jgi:hypothetical protein